MRNFIFFKSISILFFLFFVALIGAAQTINYSLPEKTSNKNYDFAVLGKTTEGIIIYKYSKSENIIQCYDNAMNLKWFKEAQLGNRGSTIQHISVHNNKIYVLFSYKKGDGILIAAQRFTPKLEAEGKLKILDSVAKETFNDNADWYVKHSEDKTKYMVYYVLNEGKQSTLIQTILINDKLKILKRLAVEVPELKENLEEELMDNEGNFYFFATQHEQSDISPKVIYNNPRYYKLSTTANIAEVKTLSDNTIKLNSMIVKIDNINHQFVLAGVAKNKAISNTPGFQITKWNIKNDSLISDKFESFSDELMKEMNLSAEMDINNYELTDIVLRFDGGMIIIAENGYITQQTVEVPNYYSPSFPTVKTYTYNHKDDILIQSRDAKANIDWSKIVRKKQSGEADNSLYSGYSLLKGKSKIQIIYNESITEQTGLLVHSFNADGGLNRTNINSSKQKNLMLMPNRATQVSLYELIIPSQFRGYLQFIKIDF